MGQYTRHVFVCTDGSWCPHDGDTEDLVKRLKQGVIAAGLKGQVRINRSGCFSQCGHGPMVVVYPAGRWYAGVQPTDAAEIVAVDLVGDQPVTRLTYDAPPGDNKDLTRYPPELVGAVQASKRGH
ncbi:MAG: hypothetical protein AUK03_06985 [Anaerolineae bacterium CG2_30_64_16]|nr:MAG: hypothetical protein AUK03_06985 [Anaerolineae bacterium CG2_30_64_16]